MFVVKNKKALTQGAEGKNPSAYSLIVIRLTADKYTKIIT